MGQRASNTSSVFFEDVVVPEEVYTCMCPWNFLRYDLLILL